MMFCFSEEGENVEMYFCEQKSLSLPTLRMTCEAKVCVCVCVWLNACVCMCVCVCG